MVSALFWFHDVLTIEYGSFIISNDSLSWLRIYFYAFYWKQPISWSTFTSATVIQTLIKYVITTSPRIYTLPSMNWRPSKMFSVTQGWCTDVCPMRVWHSLEFYTLKKSKEITFTHNETNDNIGAIILSDHIQPSHPILVP